LASTATEVGGFSLYETRKRKQCIQFKLVQVGLASAATGREQTPFLSWLAWWQALLTEKERQKNKFPLVYI